MALGDPYITRDQFKTYIGIPLTDTADDAQVDAARESVSVEVEDICERQFNNTGGTASARVYAPLSEDLVLVDDFHTTADLVIATDEDGDGVFETVWAAADYELHPLNGVVRGVPGWPYTRIKAVGQRRFPLTGRATVQETARWGWAAVPKPIVEAIKIASNETFALKDTRFGVAGWGQMGDIRVRDNPMAMKKLKPYMRNPYKVA